MYHRPLTEVEKITLRSSNEGRLQWLYNNIYKHEVPMQGKSVEEGMEVMHQLQADCCSELGKNDTVFGQTWLF
jgi:hypothetical protein